MYRISAGEKLPQVKLNFDLIRLQDGGVENGPVIFGDDNAGQMNFAESVEAAGLNIDRSAAEPLQFCFGYRWDDKKADRIKDRDNKKKPNQNRLDIQQKSMPGQVTTQKSDFQALYNDGISVLSL